MKRAVVIAVLLVASVACGKLLAKRDAGDDASPVAVVVDASTPVTCPRPLHGSPGVGYCRFRCRDLASRKFGHHARRVSSPVQYAFGKCGAYDVFAEVNAADAGITEYFADGGALVGATDTLTPDCTQYGEVPACTLQLGWTKLDAGAHVVPDEEEDEDKPPPRKL